MSNKELQNQFLPPYWILSVAFLAVSIWLLLTLRETVTLLVIGFAISYLIEPALVFLERYRVRRTVGILVLAAVFFISVLVLLVTVVPVLLREYEKLVLNFPAYVATAREKLLPVLNRLQHLPALQKVFDSPGELLSQIGPESLKGVGLGLFNTLLKGYSFTLTVVNLLLLPFIVYYISMDFKVVSPRLLLMAPESWRPKAQTLLSEMDSYISGFVRGQILICTVLFLLYALGLGLIGVELWFLLAIIAGYGNMIPYLGFATGIVLSSVMSLVTFGDWFHLLAVWAVFGAVQMLEGFVITPKILGDRVGLSPLVIILALVIGGKLFGLLGIFLAVPGAAIIKVLARHGHAWFLTKV
jgi:predicted PurR-regulated permease PerM